MKLVAPIIALLLLHLHIQAQFVADTLIQISRVDDEYPSYSPNGSKIAIMSDRNDHNFEIYVMDHDGANLKRLTYHPGLDETPVWSPDGQWIAFASNRQGQLDIFLIDPEGNNLRQITRSPGNDDHPKFSADGSKIIFNSDRDKTTQPSNYEIYEINLDGSGAVRRTNHDEWDTYPDYSPDGRQIMWRKVVHDERSYRNRNSEIFLMDPDGTNHRNLTNHPAFDGYPIWSPDGHHIAFVSDRQGPEQIYLMRSDGTGIVTLTYPGEGEEDVRPSFHPNGDKLVFNRVAAQGTAVMTVDFRVTTDPIFFNEATEVLGLAHEGSSRGVAWGDYDQDGYPDLVVANDMNQIEFLYHNRSGVGFDRVNEGAVVEAGGWSEGVQWVDYDNDHDLDLFMATQWGNPNLLFENQLDEGFRKVEAGALTGQPSSSTGSCWCDFDLDGDLDAYVTERDGADDALYLNSGQGNFERVIDFPYHGGDGRACIWGDTDMDGDQDLIVANFLDKTGETVVKHRNYYYLNQGNGQFEEVLEGVLVTDQAASYGLSLADYDDDGDPDLLVTNVGQTDLNQLYRNDGQGNFTPQSQSALVRNSGGPSKGQTWGDFDNDGDLDLYVANGTEGTAPGELRNYLYLNQGQGEFHRVTHGVAVAEEEISAGAAWSDYDRDGDLDLFVSNWGNNQQDNSLYRNDSYGNSWLALKLRGTRSNRMGIGARVRLKAIIDGTSKWQTRWATNNTGYGSQNEPIIHFGLGAGGRIEQLEVLWPSGQLDQYQEIAANQYLQVVEGEGMEAVRGAAP